MSVGSSSSAALKEYFFTFCAELLTDPADSRSSLSYSLIPSNCMLVSDKSAKRSLFSTTINQQSDQCRRLNVSHSRKTRQRACRTPFPAPTFSFLCNDPLRVISDRSVNFAVCVFSWNCIAQRCTDKRCFSFVAAPAYCFVFLLLFGFIYLIYFDVFQTTHTSFVSAVWTFF